MSCGEHRRLMLRVLADREQAAMDLRMQGLDPPVHHLGKAGEIGDVADLKPRLDEGAMRAAGRDQLDAEGGEAACEIDEAGLVGDGNQRPRGAAKFDRHEGLHCCEAQKQAVSMKPAPILPFAQLQRRLFASARNARRETPQTQRVKDDEDGGERHRAGGEHRRQKHAEGRDKARPPRPGSAPHYRRRPRTDFV